jgi:hypothetical protein
MKLRQNARELVLIDVEGLGMLLGEIRYNQQTETALFALEKAAFFDLYLPCTVVYDQQQGPIVHPHVLAALTTSSVRIQRSRISCFIMETDLNPRLVEQYQTLVEAIMLKHGDVTPTGRHEDQDPDRPKPDGGPGGTRVINLRDRKDKG